MSRWRPGTYSLFSIPREDNCVLILNSETDLWGAADYDSSRDVARYTAEVRRMDVKEMKLERMEFWFSDITDDGDAKLILMWDNYRVSVPIKVEVHRRAMENIKNALASEPTWRTYLNAAGYCLNSGQDLIRQGIEWVNQSLAEGGDEIWYTYWLKAKLLHADGQADKARMVGKEAIQKR